MTLATYTVWHIFGVWVLGSFLLAVAWVLIKTLDNYLNRRERRAARRTQPVPNPGSQRKRTTALPPGTPRRRVFDTEELDAIRWDWIAPYRSPLTSGRTASRRHRS